MAELPIYCNVALAPYQPNISLKRLDGRAAGDTSEPLVECRKGLRCGSSYGALRSNALQTAAQTVERRKSIHCEFLFLKPSFYEDMSD